MWSMFRMAARLATINTMTSPRNGEPGGLRELKKARTRAAIQDHALRLYLKQGYAATTVEQIAEAADVSQSTFFRYFATKAETVLYDRWDPVMIEMLVALPADLSPFAAVRTAMHDVLDNLDPETLELEMIRWRLVAEVAELRAATIERTADTAELLTEAMARRAGREPADLEVRVWVGALIGAIWAAFFTALEDPGGDMTVYVDRAIAQLEAGLPL